MSIVIIITRVATVDIEARTLMRRVEFDIYLPQSRNIYKTIRKNFSRVSNRGLFIPDSSQIIEYEAIAGSTDHICQKYLARMGTQKNERNRAALLVLGAT